MPKTTQLPFVSTATSSTSFVVVDNKLTKRLDYTTLLNNFVSNITDNILVGPQGPTGPSGQPGANGGPIPVGGNPGQVIVKTSSTNYAVEWQNPASGIPAGGTNGQVLAKTSDNNYEIAWTSSNTSLPAGGTSGQVLLKTSDDNYDATWGEFTSIPPGGDIGQVILKSSANDYEIAWGDTAPGIPTGGTVGQILAKSEGANFAVTWIDPPASAATSRKIFIKTTIQLADNGIDNISIPAYENYVILKIETSAPARVRLYSDANSRANDSLRLPGTDPTPGTGVLAEVITSSGFLSQQITPGIIGMNFDNPVSDSLYMAVTNNSGSPRAITVTLTLLNLGKLSTIDTSRILVAGTTSNLEDEQSGPSTFPAAKSYILSKISTSVPAWVRIYASQAARTADENRSIDNDPLPNSGLIAEVLTTTGQLTQLITPGVIGFNSLGGTEVYITVTNKSGTTDIITVGLTISSLEI
jgi:hypothetical protein